MRRNLWIWIALLGLADIGLTCWGLANGWIAEANPLMAYLFAQGTAWAVAYAVFANVLLVYLIHTAEASFWWVTPALQLVFVFKVFILITHVRWLVAVFA